MSISVLVVEDQPELRTTIHHMLEEHGYAVRCVATVEEAVAALNEIPHPCLVLWDPATLPVSAALVAHTARRGVHLATIPVGITSTGQAADGSPIISKRLTSREAILNVVREHCRPDEEERASQWERELLTLMEEAGAFPLVQRVALFAQRLWVPPGTSVPCRDAKVVLLMGHGRRLTAVRGVAFAPERAQGWGPMSTAQCLAVLIVEDEDDIRELVFSALSSEGFQVYQANTGARALELLREIPHPSLILADLMMPIMDGWELIKALSQDDRLATLPVVVISAVDQAAPEGFRRVKKPFDLDELVKIVAELCVRRT